MSGRVSNNIPPSLRQVWQKLESNNMASERFTGPALVTHDLLQNNGWKIDNVTTGELQDDQLVIEMVGSGVCHTDIMVGTPQ